MNYTLNISPEHLQYIVQCLEQGPYRMSAPVLASIMTQVQHQDRDRQAQADQDAKIASGERRWAEMEDQMRAAAE